MLIAPEAIAKARDALTARFEGCRLRAYQDPSGIWSIGYGATRLANGDAVTDGMVLTAAQADWLLYATLRVVAERIEAWLPPWTTPLQAAALLDFAFNCGATAFKDSTLLRLFQAGDVAGAADEFGKWVKDRSGATLRGLVDRRAAERELFLSDTQAGADVAEDDGENLEDG